MFAMEEESIELECFVGDALKSMSKNVYCLPGFNCHKGGFFPK